MGTVLVSRKPSTASSLSIFTKRKPTRGFGFNSSHVMAKTANRQQAVKNNKVPSYDLSQISMRPQAKLTVNKPGDAYEQEADKVAQQVVQRQKKSQQGEEEEKLQTKSLANGITPIIQRAKSSKKAKAPKASGSKNDSNKVESPKQKEKAPEAGTSEKPEADNSKAEDKKDAANKEKASEAGTSKKPEADNSKAEDKKDAPEKKKDKKKKTENDNKNYKEMVNKAGSWDKVKKNYLKDTKTMQGLIKFRKEEVGSIINEVRKSLETDAQNLKDIAPGSTDLTSDYDVTFDGGENKSLESKAVKEFNKLFRERWGKESGTIFDTNVYTTGHMPTGKDKEEKEKDKGRTQWQMTKEGEKKSDKLLDEMALLKIRRNMSQSQWEKYQKNMLNGIKDKNTKKETEARLKKAEQLHQESQKEFKNKISKLSKEHKSLLNKLKSKLKNKKNQDTEMAANNQLYESYLTKGEENLTELEALRTEVEKQQIRTKEQAKKLDDLTLKLQEMRSKALVFANEAYHTGGAVEHVVLNQQMKQGISINNNQYLQSINEQTGFAVEQINDHKNMGMALWKSSKYVDRLCDAINNIHKNHKEEGFKQPEKQKEMSNLAKELLDIKKSKEEKLATDKQKSNAAKKLAKDYKINSKDQYLKDILTMNTEVNQQIREKTDGEKKPKQGGKQSPQQQASSSNVASKSR
ncbi:hypothetical protein [Rivularia sp. UHCC 0363]|uniref:hypothetical protein n=1 Tax=Rivularia sp. UHCC 0363 TaxID=3110244 RepID=UPI002B1EEEE0|nr:hypothetical protein [Rivularia sp. UHCC 0363]MEA5597121.1 hypothetical protein [Rivularia sp. UHCC 0363]